MRFVQASPFVVAGLGLSCGDLVIDVFPPDNQQLAEKTCWSELHHRNTDREKVSIVSELREHDSRLQEVIANDGMTPLNSIGHKIRINIGNIGKWEKDEASLLNKDMDKVVGQLIAKTPPESWLEDAERERYHIFLLRRQRKLKATTVWILASFKNVFTPIHHRMHMSGRSCHRSGSRSSGRTVKLSTCMI